jgi:hypothetical protein
VASPGRIYVAGPMTGRHLYNWPWFENTARVLRRMGWDVVTPTEIDEECGMVIAQRGDDGTILDVQTTDLFDYEEILQRDFEAVRTCTHILLHPEWNQSSGARRELAVALGVGALPVLYKEVFTDER